MKQFKADLHIHTLLSPCGSLEMSPANIVQSALNAQLDIIAITDHNSTKQAPLIQQMAANKGLTVFCGAEVNTSEEVHCLVLFENNFQLLDFQCFIDENIIPVKNNPDLFGDQIVVDIDEMIVEEVDYLLISALKASLLEVEQKVHALGGLVIPAHVDRYYNGLFSQLGFMPENLKVDGLELSKNANIEEWRTSGKIPPKTTIIQNSDAHYPSQIGTVFSFYNIKEPSFSELKMALYHQKGRSVEIV
ncbi:MAG TPA: PHP domain-containing protein [Prolixibacteraceae bacterium]|nr:PHP domain-containing protein [Prolixibacteraceae bacterium]